MNRKWTIEAIKQVARSRGGDCLSAAYANGLTKLLWRCAKGHTWQAIPRNVLYLKRWCPLCNGKIKLTLEEMRRIARSQGGDCLSEQYGNARTPLLWICANKHRWRAMPYEVKAGTWCGRCAGVAKLTIPEIQDMVRPRGGILVSQNYVRYKEPLEWMCGQGHHWRMSLRTVKRGFWCPYCRKVKRSQPVFQEIVRLIESKGGICLTTKPISLHARSCLRVRCPRGHIWRPRILALQKGHWCLRCLGFGKTIDEMQEMAHRHHARCLSKVYRNGKTMLRWECSMGHIFWALPRTLERRFQCPRCDPEKGNPYTFEMIEKIITDKGGRCLTGAYEFTNALTRMAVECGQGHHWEPLAASLKRGSWCPYCAGKVKKTIEEMHHLAQTRGGYCLSDQYVNNQTPLLWQCRQGHQWRAKPHGIARGHWCLICSGHKTKTIQDMRTLARLKGGACLSRIYSNNHTPLKWRCGEGHVFFHRPNDVAQGGLWCSRCRKSRSVEKRRLNNLWRNNSVLKS
ncbi:MAG: hypothetical protein HYT79_03040 [Elusimicrobia bacterium]|nr:hypothetical protein [Elusimicrobiota bacterium]